MKKFWMSAVASLALFATANGCNVMNPGKPATDAARGIGNASGNAAGTAGNALRRGANAVGNATGQGLNTVGRGVQRGANAVGNAAGGGLNALGNGVRNGANRLDDATGLNNRGTNVQPDGNTAGAAAGGIGNGLNTVLPYRNPITNLPSVSVNSGLRIVTVRYHNLTTATNWALGGANSGWQGQQMSLIVPSGWTVQVAGSNPTNGANRSVIGLMPRATAVSAATAALLPSITTNTPGRYYIAAMVPRQRRNILANVVVSPTASNVSFAFGRWT